MIVKLATHSSQRATLKNIHELTQHRLDKHRRELKDISTQTLNKRSVLAQLQTDFSEMVGKGRGVQKDYSTDSQRASTVSRVSKKIPEASSREYFVQLSRLADQTASSLVRL